MANGQTTQSSALFWMPQFSDGWAAHGSLSELPRQSHSEAFSSVWTCGLSHSWARDCAEL